MNIKRKIITIVLLTISVFSWLNFWHVKRRELYNHSLNKTNAEIVDDNVNIFNNKQIKNTLNTGNNLLLNHVSTTEQQASRNLSRDVLKKLNQENNTNKIIAFIDTGRGGIREIVAHDPGDNYFDRRNINGDYDYSGTVFLFSANATPHDSYTTYFGHNMQDGTKFSKLEKYSTHRPNLQQAKVYTNEGILSYELILIAKVDSHWYANIPTWNYQGVRKFFAELGQNSELIERNENFIPQAKYMFLSTCYENGNAFKVVAVYKQMEE